MRGDRHSEYGVRSQMAACHPKGQLRVRGMVAWQPESLAAASGWWHGIPSLLTSWTYKDTICIPSEETNLLWLSKCVQREQAQSFWKVLVILILQSYSWRVTFL